MFTTALHIHLHPAQTKFMDVITINRYYSWYNDPGHTETIATQLSADLQQWYQTRGKPMMLTEYGAGTVAGIHRVRYEGYTVCDAMCVMYTCSHVPTSVDLLNNFTYIACDTICRLVCIM